MIKLVISLPFGCIEKTFQGTEGHAQAVQFMRNLIKQGQQVLSHKMTKVG